MRGSQIKMLDRDEKLTPEQIAGTLGLNVKTVRKWLETERYEPRRAQPRSTRLDPYKPMVQRLLERHAYTAVQVLRLLREQGYTGGYTAVKEYVRRVRPPSRTAYLTLAFAPGECAQIDWGTAGVVTEALEQQLAALKLPFLRQHYQDTARQAVAKALGHVDYLAMLIDGEHRQRQQHSTERRIRQARFPYLKTLDQFDFSFPKRIDRLKVQDLFRLTFVRDHANVMFVGGCGLGKTHLAIAMAHQACLAGHSVLFTTAIDLINVLSAAQAVHRLDQELRRYAKPDVLLLDELGYLPIDRYGADLLFQVISARYERGSIILTTNRAFKDWAVMFNNDATLTSAVLDRLVLCRATGPRMPTLPFGTPRPWNMPPSPTPAHGARTVLWPV